jgi:hypothetical protein
MRSYIDELEDARSDIRVPDQTHNMDETGCDSRPTKAQKKTIVDSKVCITKAVCREESDLKHVSLVATMNLLGQRLKPRYFRMNNVALRAPDLQLLSGNLVLYQMPKRYQNSYSMDFYVCKILAPYCENFRNVMHDPTLPVFLIMDNCPSHNQLAPLTLYAQENIRVIWLPPHSSHFLQPLDLGLFGELNGRYQRSSRKLTRRQWQGKVFRIDHAWHGSTYALNI